MKQLELKQSQFQSNSIAHTHLNKTHKTNKHDGVTSEHQVAPESKATVLQRIQRECYTGDSEDVQCNRVRTKILRPKTGNGI